MKGLPCLKKKKKKEKQQQHKNTNVNSLGIFLSFPKEDQILFKESKSREFKMITPRLKKKTLYNTHAPFAWQKKVFQTCGGSGSLKKKKKVVFFYLTTFSLTSNE